MILLIPLFNNQANTADNDILRVDFLDVGQGLAVVVETREHLLLYDTGPSFGSGTTAAELAVVPFLLVKGRIPDLLVISHADSDHAGGLQELRKHYPELSVMSPEPAHLMRNEDKTCQRGISWSWDGAFFEVLHPVQGTTGNRNNQSCVLKIEFGDHVLLLTGDIEAATEAALVREFGNRLSSTVMQVPHHGSRSSSTRRFICSVQPSLAIVSTGYENRWGFPQPDIVERYRDQGIAVFDTAMEGAIGLEITPGHGLVKVSGHRLENPAIWRATTKARVASIQEFQYDSQKLRQQDAKLDEAKNQCLN